MHNAVIIRHITIGGHRIVAVSGSTEEELMQSGQKWLGDKEYVAGTCDIYDPLTIPSEWHGERAHG